jgi:formylglycine-generating enzyme required for sulfatase activity
MGSPETDWGRGLKDENRTAVTLTHGFEIGEYEVTQSDWAAQGFPNPSQKFDSGPSAGQGDCLTPQCPVGNVNWFEAVSFANKLSQAHSPPLESCYTLNGCTGAVGQGLSCASATLSTATAYECEGYRLPTDAEWEYAARAGTSTSFYTGNITVYSKIGPCYPDAALEPIAWYCNNAAGSTHPIGGLQPNAWGLFDVIGNAYEWVHSHYTGASPSGPVTDPAGEADETWPERSVRSSAYYSWSTLCRVSSFSMSPWNLAAPGRGFRLARTLK